MFRIARNLIAVSRAFLSQSSTSSANQLHLRLVVSDTCSLCGRFANSLDLYAKTVVDTRPITYTKVNIKDLPEELREKHQYDIPVLLDESDNLLVKHRFSRSAFEERIDELARKVVVLHGGVTFRDSQDAVDACKSAMRSSDGAVDAVENLELCGSFNAGRGSSLSREGAVEMEAAVCRLDEQGEMSFGAVGAATRLASPVRVAEAISDSASERENDGLVDPMVVVGEGAEKWAEDHGLASLVLAEKPARTPEAEKEWTRALLHFRGEGPSLSSLDEALRAMDTVGAAELTLDDWSSTVACSSGGIILKRPGRLGHCTVFGAGAWVEEREWLESSFHRRRLVSLCVSGCGEAIVRVDAAREIARRITQRCDSTPLPAVIYAFFKEHFHAESRLLRRMNPAHLYLGGVAIVREEKRRTEGGEGKRENARIGKMKVKEADDVDDEEDSEGEEDDDEEDDSLELLIFHNTPFLPLAWRDAQDKVRAMMSRRAKEAVTVTVLPL